MSLLLRRRALSFQPPATLDGSMQIDADDEQMSIASFASSAPNRRTFTISLWAWHAASGDAFPLFFPYWHHSGSDVSFQIFFDGDEGFDSFGAINYADFSDDDVNLAEFIEGAFTRNQWRHYVFRVDTTLATAADRVRIYRDNVEQSPVDPLNPTQNLDTSAFLNASLCRVGHDSAILGGGAVNKIVRFADLIVVEGQSLVPTEFGYNNGGTWSWKPYAGSFGSHGFRLNPTGSGDLGQDKSGNGYNFTNSGVTFSSEKPPV